MIILHKEILLKLRFLKGTRPNFLKIKVFISNSLRLKCKLCCDSPRSCAQALCCPTSLAPYNTEHFLNWKRILKNQTSNFLENTILCYDFKLWGLLKAVYMEQFNVMLSSPVFTDLRTSIWKNTEVSSELFLQSLGQHKEACIKHQMLRLLYSHSYEMLRILRKNNQLPEFLATLFSMC